MRFLLLLICVPIFASAQNAVIRGVAPLAIGEVVQLRVMADPITGKERVLASQTIDVDGSFELKAIPNGIEYTFLQVGNNCADFFIGRNSELELSFVPPKPDPLKPRAFNERQFFMPKITGGSGRKLNAHIIAINDSIDRFLEIIYPYLKQRKSPALIAKRLATFESMMNSLFASAESFVKDYLKFTIAGVEQTFLTDRNRLFDKYLKGQNPQFNNPAYTDFVLQFYQGEVYNLVFVNKVDECKTLLTQRDFFSKLDEMLLEQEPLLNNVSVRRMVLIEGFSLMLENNDYNNERLITELKQFGMVSSNSYLGNAAKNLAEKYETMTEGTVAPDITYFNSKGKKSKLSDLPKAYTFLELTDATNAYANRETNVIPNLKNEFRNIQFATICVGNSEAEVAALKRKMNIDWELGRIELSSQTLYDYRIKSLPLFFIIDPEGKFYACPAEDPTKGAQQQLMSLSEKLKAKSRGKVGK